MVLGLFVIAYILASLLWIEAVPISASPPSPNDSSSSDCPDGQLSCARRLFDTSSDLSNAAAAVVVATAITAPVKYDFSNIMFWRPQKVYSHIITPVNYFHCICEYIAGRLVYRALRASWALLPIWTPCASYRYYVVSF